MFKFKLLFARLLYWLKGFQYIICLSSRDAIEEANIQIIEFQYIICLSSSSHRLFLMLHYHRFNTLYV